MAEHRQVHELGYEGLGKVGGCNGGNLVLWGESSR